MEIQTHLIEATDILHNNFAAEYRTFMTEKKLCANITFKVSQTNKNK